MAVELFDTHRKMPELNPFLPFAKSMCRFPVIPKVYGAGIFRAEEPHDS